MPDAFSVSRLILMGTQSNSVGKVETGVGFRKQLCFEGMLDSGQGLRAPPALGTGVRTSR